jgi:hypothetical protein
MPPSDVNALPKTALLCIDDDHALLEYEKGFSRTLWLCRRDRIQWPRRSKRAIKIVD